MVMVKYKQLDGLLFELHAELLGNYYPSNYKLKVWDPQTRAMLNAYYVLAWAKAKVDGAVYKCYTVYPIITHTSYKKVNDVLVKMVRRSKLNVYDLFTLVGYELRRFLKKEAGITDIIGVDKRHTNARKVLDDVAIFEELGVIRCIKREKDSEQWVREPREARIAQLFVTEVVRIQRKGARRRSEDGSSPENLQGGQALAG